jgi:hypothetical protein
MVFFKDKFSISLFDITQDVEPQEIKLDVKMVIAV